ncbi:MAG: hypothetical protein LBD73_07345 [Deferribacteraceae bacterium]|jgi:hypothetical protein|nr:hypothetical protein [Deferribacteraceae bacterium]
MRKNAAFAEKNGVLFYLDYPVTLPSLFYGDAYKTEEAADILVSLILQETRNTASRKSIILSAELSAEGVVIRFETTPTPTEQSLGLFNAAIHHILEGLRGEFNINGGTFILNIPLKAAESPKQTFRLKGENIVVISKTEFQKILVKKLKSLGAEVAAFAGSADIDGDFLREKAFSAVFVEAEDSPALAVFIKSLAAVKRPPKCILMKRGVLPDVLKNLLPVVYSVNAANSEIKKML